MILWTILTTTSLTLSIFKWKNTVLGKDFPLRMTSKNQGKQKELLLKEVEELQKQVHQLQLEKALLEESVELLKKKGSIIYGTDESELILQSHFHFRY